VPRIELRSFTFRTFLLQKQDCRRTVTEYVADQLPIQALKKGRGKCNNGHGVLRTKLATTINQACS